MINAHNFTNPVDRAFEDIKWVNDSTGTTPRFGITPELSKPANDLEEIRAPHTLGDVALRAMEAVANFANKLRELTPRQRLALSGLALAGVVVWGNTPHEIASAPAFIETGDGGVRTTCHTADDLARGLGLDPEKGDNCVEAGQRIGAALHDQHPKRAIQPGEGFKVSLTQTPFQANGGEFSINAVIG